MSYLKLFQKQIPMAAEIVADAESIADDWSGEAVLLDVVCKVGLSLKFYQYAREWLDAEEGRRLFFIEENPGRLKGLLQEEDSILLLNDKRVKIFYLETPLQKEIVARRVGALSAFKKLTVVGSDWEPKILEAQLEAELLASEWADFGVRVMAHKRLNEQYPLHSMEALEGSLKGVPAVIVGAGPSLQENQHLIPFDRAFVIAAGNAIEALEKKPHLAVAVCPHNPMIRTKYREVPLCIQERVHPESLKNIEGPILSLSESFVGGWTVGNMAVAIAIHLGCSPIVLVGMDFCYRGEQKYAPGVEKRDSAPLLEAIDQKGNRVWTQRDWILSVGWMEEQIQKHPEIEFFNASNGLRIGKEASLESFQWKKRELSLPQAPLAQPEVVDFEQFLERLWKVWEPLFERELMGDLQPLSLQEKLAIQKKLFFEQVRLEHG